MENTSTASSLTSCICLHTHHGGLEGDTEKSLGSAYLSGKLWRVNSIKIKSRLNSAWAPPPFLETLQTSHEGYYVLDTAVRIKKGKKKPQKQPHLEFGSISYSTARLFTDWCFWSVTFLSFFSSPPFLFFQGMTTAGSRQKPREWYSKDALGCYYRALPT